MRDYTALALRDGKFSQVFAAQICFFFRALNLAPKFSLKAL
ncbi:hypothetical protein CSUNSWCD_45 [Campylobacter showae CSUNSWCD]|uniref:Uncharacterized protein n=1 Tax=Campylobacter showae CSUNSWCD TaxID=1244083 RepID=M5ILM9_9BACT|nr:hypothetical protein CSUNSWCD_45 [Campylobacter showae CSUNSWCD]